MDAEKQRREDRLKDQDGFRTNAYNIILKMLEWYKTTPGSRKFVEEMIHSIFFLGNINQPRFTPKQIFPDKKVLETLKEEYPQPFDFYSTQLPRRSPFSCVMDMIVLQKGQKNENQIIQSLRDLIKTLEPKFLVSSTICISEKSNIPNAVKYYGVSMSTSGWKSGRIMVAASCFSFWDDYVAGAVMTYYPNKVKKSDFDGTIKVPEYVRCEAFSLSKEEKMPPCRSCGNLFGLHTTEKQEWAYGNCAEAESLSNLLKNEKDVKEKARPTSKTYTEKNRQKAEGNVLKELKSLLGMERWDYYTP